MCQVSPGNINKLHSIRSIGLTTIQKNHTWSAPKGKGKCSQNQKKHRYRNNYFKWCHKSFPASVGLKMII